MSGLYGLGRAFNLKYRPNGPMKTFIYDRRMPMMFDYGARRCHGGSYMQENLVIDYGKRGFWGNFADILQGLTMGAFAFTQIFGMFGGGKSSDIVEGPEESKKPKPQGAKSDDGQNLKRLQTLAKGKDITIIQEENGKFTLVKDNQSLKNADYKDAQDWIINFNSDKSKQVATPDNKANVKQTSIDDEAKKKAEAEAKAKAEAEAKAKAEAEAKAKAEAEAKANAADNNISTPSTTKKNVSNNVRKSPTGWYPATSDKQEAISKLSIEELKEAESGGKSAPTYLLEQLLGSKNWNSLSAENKAELLNELIKKNPSVFTQDVENSDGIIKSGGRLRKDADISKLDVPSIDWIVNNIGVKPKTDKSPVNTIRGNNGYYAQYDKNGNVKYYNPSGKEISANSFKDNCPTIYKQINNKIQTNNLNNKFGHSNFKPKWE